MKNNLLKLIILSLMLSVISCKKKEEIEEELEDVSDEDISIPQVGSIILSGLGEVESTTLQSESECDKSKLGIMGIALGGACHSAPLASKILLGSESGDYNNDNSVNCLDFKTRTAAGKDAGILMSLMCLDFFKKTKNLETFSFQETSNSKNSASNISFESFNTDNSAVGKWTRGDESSYPADIRLWTSKTSTNFADMKGFFAASLKTLNEGEVQVQGIADGIDAVVEFKNTIDSTKCISEPSRTNCYFQDIKISNTSTAVDNVPPNGFHLKLLADSKTKAKLYIIEGLYRYKEELAAAIWKSSDNADLLKIRTIYFQTVQKGKQIWGRFEFRDENDEIIESFAPNTTVDILADYSKEEGVCQNLGEDKIVACTDVDYTKFNALFDKSTMSKVEQSPIDANFTDDKATKAEICIKDGACTDIPAF